MPSQLTPQPPGPPKTCRLFSLSLSPSTSHTIRLAILVCWKEKRSESFFKMRKSLYEFFLPSHYAHPKYSLHRFRLSASKILLLKSLVFVWMVGMDMPRQYNKRYDVCLPASSHELRDFLSFLWARQPGLEFCWQHSGRARFDSLEWDVEFVFEMAKRQRQKKGDI